MNDDITQAALETLAAALGEALLARGARVATAESCTGGWLAQCLTAIAGSSAWFERGFVTYSNAAKEASLGVPAATLAAFGAVSEETAAAMAQGTLAHADAIFSVGITGIAGPGGATRANRWAPCVLDSDWRANPQSPVGWFFRATDERCGRGP